MFQLHYDTYHVSITNKEFKNPYQVFMKHGQKLTHGIYLLSQEALDNKEVFEAITYLHQMKVPVKVYKIKED